MTHMLKVSAVERSAPIAMLIGFKTYDSTFQEMHHQELSPDHDEQHFKPGSCFDSMRSICR